VTWGASPARPRACVAGPLRREEKAGRRLEATRRPRWEPPPARRPEPRTAATLAVPAPLQQAARAGRAGPRRLRRDSRTAGRPRASSRIRLRRPRVLAGSEARRRHRRRLPCPPCTTRSSRRPPRSPTAPAEGAAACYRRPRPASSRPARREASGLQGDRCRARSCCL
jgi:hypothetical protein